MLSRVANSLFWMSRYVERAENVARFMHVNLQLLLDGSIAVSENQWASIIATSGDDEDFKKRYGKPVEDKVIYFLTFDKENPNSILSCIGWAREYARTVRDTISSEIWEHINQMYLMIQKNSRKRKVKDLHQLFTEIKMGSHLFSGLLDATMSHGEGRNFSRIGTFLERADKTARILDVKYFILLPKTEDFNTPLDAVQWGAVLKSVSGFEMYRKRYQIIHFKDVIQFMIFDKKFPRSLVFCIDCVAYYMNSIARDLDFKPSSLSLIEDLQKDLNLKNVEDVIQMGMHEFIDLFQCRVNDIGNSINLDFFDRKKTHKINNYCQ